MKTKIIAAPPGCGKTYASKYLPNAIDLEYSHYAWITEDEKKVRDLAGNKIQNFAFPKNYIDKIKSCVEKYDYVFICTCDFVLKELIKEGLEIIVIIPSLDMLPVWVRRFQNRNDNPEFITNQKLNWYKRISELQANKENFQELIEIGDEYLLEIIRRKESERMRDKNRLDGFYEELCKIHKESFPDWRFGQFCSNFFGWLWSAKKIDLFFPEEEKMIEYIREYANTNGMRFREN